MLHCVTFQVSFQLFANVEGGHCNNAYGAAVTSKDLIVMTSSDSRAVEGNCLQTLKGHGGAVRGVVVLPKDLIVTASHDMMEKVWGI